MEKLKGMQENITQLLQEGYVLFWEREEKELEATKAMLTALGKPFTVSEDESRTYDGKKVNITYIWLG